MKNDEYHVYIGIAGELFIVLHMDSEGYDGILYNERTGFSYVSIISTQVDRSSAINDLSTASEEELFQMDMISDIPYSSEFIQKVQKQLKETDRDELRGADYKICIIK